MREIFKVNQFYECVQDFMIYLEEELQYFSSMSFILIFAYFIKSYENLSTIIKI